MRNEDKWGSIAGIRTNWVTVTASSALIAYVAGIMVTKMLGPFRMIVVVGVGIGACLVALVIGYRFAQQLRRRLYDIEEAAALIARGRLHHRVGGMGSGDEIDRLASQFNQMGETLEEQVTLLQRLAEDNRLLAVDAQRAATMEERQRLARELHDSVSQQLFALNMMAETALRHVQSGSEKLPATLATIADLAHRSQREMRALLLHLRPVELDGRNFVEATEAFLQAVEERHGLCTTFTCEASGPIPPTIEEHLFRILQEALANVLKHAEASQVRVQLLVQATTYELSITDDGGGLPTSDTTVADSYGITAMRERAAALGGKFNLLPREQGTTVSVVIPRTGRGDIE